MILNGNAQLNGSALQLTNGGQDEAGSAFYATPVNIQAFTTDFTFQLSNPSADGMTFTIQNVGTGALGGAGGSLGYDGIGESVAIKFDLYSNAGEGPDSTGLYTDGAAPNVPAIDLSSTGINLHSGDPMAVNITYNGTNLSLTITDTVTLATWSDTFAVNIPAIVGGDTAYVGFTGGTGGLTSTQRILTWTYVVASSSGASSPQLGISATSVAFGSVAVNTASTQTLTLSSTGTEAVTVSAATVTGNGFTMSGATFPVTLNPGLAVTLDVGFDPTTTGAATGKLTIQSNSSTSGTALVSLTGTGTPPQVDLSWEAPSSSPMPIVGYDIYRSTGGTSTYQLVNSSVDTETTYVDSTVQSGSTYDYMVKSVDSSGVQSAPSSAVSVTVP